MNKKIIKTVLIILFASFLSAVGMKLIIIETGLLSEGVSGISLMIARLINYGGQTKQMETILYSLFYVILNLPLFIFGLKNLGKKFSILFMINVMAYSLIMIFLPLSLISFFQFDQLNEPIVSAILAGLLIGYGRSIAFNNDFSYREVDIINAGIVKKCKKGIKNTGLIINALILFIWVLIFKNTESLIYTLIYIFVKSLVINFTYIKNKKILLEIVTQKGDLLSDLIINKFNTTCTIMDVVGGFTKNEKKQLNMVITHGKLKNIMNDIKEIDPESFVSVFEVDSLYGGFYNENVE